MESLDIANAQILNTYNYNEGILAEKNGQLYTISSYNFVARFLNWMHDPMGQKVAETTFKVLADLYSDVKAAHEQYPNEKINSQLIGSTSVADFSLKVVNLPLFVHLGQVTVDVEGDKIPKETSQERADFIVKNLHSHEKEDKNTYLETCDKLRFLGSVIADLALSHDERLKPAESKGPRLR